mmetsp:Transcript_8463/g.23872  ORF Transcript_8463/g.23872 Transcript_8463/m.23872 type:complete len:576 (-) Transcript_8463:2549-4276(-)
MHYRPVVAHGEKLQRVPERLEAAGLVAKDAHVIYGLGMMSQRGDDDHVDAVPQLHGAVAGGRRQEAAVRGVGAAGDGVSVLALPGRLRLAEGVPHPHRAVRAGRHHRLPIGVEPDCLDGARVAREPADLPPGGGVPHADGAIVGARYEKPAVAGETTVINALRMARNGGDLLPAEGVPDLHGAVVGGRHDTAAVLVEGARAHCAAVAPQDVDGGLRVALREVPHVQIEVPAARNQALAGVGEGHAVDPIHQVLHSENNVTRRRVPHADGVVPGRARDARAVGGVGTGLHHVTVPLVRLHAGTLLGEVPADEQEVLPRRNNGPAVGADAAGVNGAPVALHCKQGPSRGGPRASGPIVRHRHDHVPLGAHARHVHNAGMAAQHRLGVAHQGVPQDHGAVRLRPRHQVPRREELHEHGVAVRHVDAAHRTATHRVPNAYRLVVRRGHEVAPVLAEADLVDGGGVPFDDLRNLPQLHVPHQHGAIHGRGYQPRSVGGEGYGTHGVAVAAQGRHHVGRLRLPHHHGRIPRRRGDQLVVRREGARADGLGVVLVEALGALAHSTRGHIRQLPEPHRAIPRR